MKTIAVVCEKGGTGKSVIANEAVRTMCRMVSTLAGLLFEHKVLKK